MVVKTKKNPAVAADVSVAAQRWPHRLNDLISTISTRLTRPETQRTAHDLLRGLLVPLPRKNRWTLSEHAGHRTRARRADDHRRPGRAHPRGLGGRRRG
ncbi:hypothetical protein [Nocardiopsis sp. CNR-923]|uniref:hypothetical protein n=1 Tax=Nocardiopsis sp. CNR-923 TaxID=1904965 RepID=UPI0016513FD5|nr:hypothetical protein [Nocardiopsis sp. CNR-923]